MSLPRTRVGRQPEARTVQRLNFGRPPQTPDLVPEDQIALAHALAEGLTADKRLPDTLALHAGRDADGHEHNPHAHWMDSEKSRAFQGREWMEHARARWADLTTATPERCGRHERVDRHGSSVTRRSRSIAATRSWTRPCGVKRPPAWICGSSSHVGCGRGC